MNQSTNFGLKTTGDNDQWRDTLDYHNENMGVIDAVLDANQDALGIVVDGNKSALGASSGQFIILRNSTISGKADGLYKAAKAIPANTAIDGTYLTPVPDGGLNALNSNLAGKANFVDLGNRTGIGEAFDALTIYDRPVLCLWDNYGKFWGLLYKYTGGNYGMGICQQYYQTDITLLSVSNGTKTQKTIS